MKLKFTRKTWYFFLLAAAAMSMLGGFAVLGGMDFSGLELIVFCITGIAVLFLAAHWGTSRDNYQFEAWQSAYLIIQYRLGLFVRIESSVFDLHKNGADLKVRKAVIVVGIRALCNSNRIGIIAFCYGCSRTGIGKVNHRDAAALIQEGAIVFDSLLNQIEGGRKQVVFNDVQPNFTC